MEQSRLSRFSPYLYILPAFIFYLLFNFGPAVGTVIFSFFEWDSFFPTTVFAGIENYRYILTDSLFWGALKNNMIFMALSVTIPVFLGLILAILISDIKKGKTFYRAILFMPCIFSGVVIAFTWKWIYHPFVGILNAILDFLNLGVLKQSWLGDPRFTLYSCFIAYAWATFGYSLVIYLSGLQNIDQQVYEAADIEGAGFFQKFIHITIPLLRETTTFVITLRILTSMAIFDVIYNLTGGGPYYSSNVIAIYSYNMLNNMKMGWGSAAVTINAIIIVTMSILFIRWREKKS